MIKHISADGYVIKNIAGHLVEINDNTKIAYNLIAKMEGNK